MFRDPEQKKAYQRKWRAENIVGLRAKERGKKRVRDPIKLRASHKLWRSKNKHRITGYMRKRRESSAVRMMDAVRARVHRALTRQKAWKTGKTVDMLGCSVEELRAHLEKLFAPGMTWDNWGRYGWHIDHKVPLAAFDLKTEEGQRSAMHYSNLQPLWASDNLKKWKHL